MSAFLNHGHPNKAVRVSINDTVITQLYFDVSFYVRFLCLILYLLQSFAEIESDHVVREFASDCDALYISLYFYDIKKPGNFEKHLWSGRIYIKLYTKEFKKIL